MKRGWHTPKGMIAIFFVGLVVLNVLGLYFGGVFTGSVVQSVGGKVILEVNQKVEIGDTMLELWLVSPSSVSLLVDGQKVFIREKEIKVVKGLQMTVIETVDNEGESSDSAVLYIREVGLKEFKDGYYKLVEGEKIEDVMLTVSPINSNTVMFKLDNVMEEVSVGKTVRVKDVVVSLVDVKDFVGSEFDEVQFYVTKASFDVECFGCEKYDLVYGDEVDVFGKSLTLMGVDELGQSKLSVDGRIGVLRVKDHVTVNGLSLYVESVSNNDMYLDRVVVSVEKEVGY